MVIEWLWVWLIFRPVVFYNQRALHPSKNPQEYWDLITKASRKGREYVEQAAQKAQDRPRKSPPHQREVGFAV